MRRAVAMALLAHSLPLLITFAGTRLTCSVGLSQVTGANVILPTIHAAGLNKAVDDDTGTIVEQQLIVATLEIKNEIGVKVAEDAAQTGLGELQTYARTTVPEDKQYVAHLEGDGGLWDLVAEVNCSDSFFLASGQTGDCSQLRTPSSEQRRVVAAIGGCDDGDGGNGSGTTEEPYTPGTPIVIDLGRAGFRFTSLEDGVLFDLDADGALERISWSAMESGDAFLALDRNANGWIDDGTELFGNYTEQPASPEPHGFLALAVFDEDHDGSITPADSVFPRLRLWVDASHDGQSQPGELIPLGEGFVRSIGVEPVESRRRDLHGNELRYMTLVRLSRGSTQAVDVFLLVLR